MILPDHPAIYEINAAVFLGELSRTYQRRVTFGNVPAEVWDELAELPIDAVWFMGVWQRSPLARQLAGDNPDLKRALPDLQPDDILGSAYSVYDYTVDEHFGGDAALAKARAELARRDIGLILDYVPNHVALDHPWTVRHADHLIIGTPEDLRASPDAFAERPAGIIARGKDPQYPPWSDVAQLNAFSPALRAAVTELLKKISDQCDGVRCDMAMLMTNKVFAKTWGAAAGQRPAADYWQTIIPAVKQHDPDFRFIAEVYWGMQHFLLTQGFDFCYDKTLYDDLIEGSAAAVRRHLRHTHNYREQLLYFIENHDEPRAAFALPGARTRAAAVIMATLPGARLFHEGQFEGRRVRVPVHLNRRPTEPVNTGLQHFYRQLLAAADSLRSDTNRNWQPLTVETRRARRESTQLLAWSWQTEHAHYLAIINYSPRPACGRLRLPPTWRKPRILCASPGADIARLFSSGSVGFGSWGYAIVRVSARP